MVTRRAFMGGLLGVVAALAVTPAIEASPTAAPAVPLETGGEALQVGDVFTIQGRYAVNPITHKSTGVLQRFVVTQTTSAKAIAASPNNAWSSDKKGVRPLFYPPMVGAGEYQNVTDASPFQASDIQPGVWLPTGVTFHPEAFSMTMQPLAVRVLH
jgi:hypothetical protein